MSNYVEDYVHSIGQHRASGPSTHCGECGNVRLADPGNPNWCSLCLRFKRIAPILLTTTQNRYCVCTCDCAMHEMEDPFDMDFTPEARTNEHPANWVEPFALAYGSSADGVRAYLPESEDHYDAALSSMARPDETEIDQDEQDRFGRGLDDREAMEMHHAGFDLNQLRTQFPELNDIHPVRATLTNITCPHCGLDQDALLLRAIQDQDSDVDRCGQCDLPTLAIPTENDPNYEGCLCRCDCHDLDSPLPPMYQPFRPNHGMYTPAAWLQPLLRTMGYCLRDFAGERERRPLRPTLADVMAGRSATNPNQEYEDAYYHRFSWDVFPNGVIRDRVTVSGLPLLAERFLRRQDANAFSHGLVEYFHVNMGDDQLNHEDPGVRDQAERATRRFAVVDEVMNGRTVDELDQADSHLIGLMLWLITHDDAFPDRAGDSGCSQEEHGFTREDYNTYLWRYDDPYEVVLHLRRHMERRLARLVMRGGYETNDYLIDAVANRWARLAFEDWEPPATSPPGPFSPALSSPEPDFGM